MLTFKSSEELQAWGERLSRRLKPGDVVALVGELGAGKTTLVQGIAAGWGYTRRANSPTFALVNEYQSPRGSLRHMDMYRMTEKELENFPLEEYFEPESVALVEWANRVRSRWPEGTLAIELQIVSPSERRVKITASKDWQSRLRGLPR